VIRKWCRKFGLPYANQLRRRRPRLGDTWHLDEVLLTRNGQRHYLWWVVDRDGAVLDILVQRRYLNNRAEKSHQPIRQREGHMQGVQVTGSRPTLPLGI
jgi:putative transposase